MVGYALLFYFIATGPQCTFHVVVLINVKIQFILAHNVNKMLEEKPGKCADTYL